MKLATLDDGSRDGRLVVVNRAGDRQLPAHDIAPTLQRALDDWERCAPRLRALGASMETGASGQTLAGQSLLAPLPRAYEWVDASAYLNHIRLVRRARGAEPPPTLETEPLVYQGGSGALLGPNAPFPLPDAEWGLDFEAEVCVILGDVRRGLPAASAEPAIRLLMLANDWSYRNLIPAEIAKGFGFFNSKPATAFSPFAVTPDELGSSWRDGRLFRPLHCKLNGQRIGEPDAGIGMHFSFHQLVAHIALTRDLCAGTILGGGTVSNADQRVGVACLAELRSLETLARGAPETSFLRAGDRIEIDMLDDDGRSIFGAIQQEITTP